MMLFLNIMLVSVVWSNLQAQKFRKGDEDILPYLSPRSSRPPSRYRPRSAPADRQYNDSYEADVSIIFKWVFFRGKLNYWFSSNNLHQKLITTCKMIWLYTYFCDKIQEVVIKNQWKVVFWCVPPTTKIWPANWITDFPVTICTKNH
jgi:hypothetical protein